MIIAHNTSNAEMLKSDLRGIETCNHINNIDYRIQWLKSDLRGIETYLIC